MSKVPGFVEADLVADCDSLVEGTYLFTLTMTDIATGWTECLPLHTKSAEAVLVAVKQARSLFPFPLLGLDTDNGTKFINDLLLAYCQAEQITFTRVVLYIPAFFWRKCHTSSDRATCSGWLAQQSNRAWRRDTFSRYS